MIARVSKRAKLGQATSARRRSGCTVQPASGDVSLDFRAPSAVSAVAELKPRCFNDAMGTDFVARHVDAAGHAGWRSRNPNMDRWPVTASSSKCLMKRRCCKVATGKAFSVRAQPSGFCQLCENALRASSCLRDAAASSSGEKWATIALYGGLGL